MKTVEILTFSGGCYHPFQDQHFYKFHINSFNIRFEINIFTSILTRTSLIYIKCCGRVELFETYLNRHKPYRIGMTRCYSWYTRAILMSQFVASTAILCTYRSNWFSVNFYVLTCRILNLSSKSFISDVNDGLKSVWIVIKSVFN